MSPKVNYYEYLRSPEWQVVRRLALERAAGCCQLCHRERQLHVHHNNYARLGAELLSDVAVLCSDCHAKHHNIGVSLATAEVPVEAEFIDDGLPLPITFEENQLQQRLAEQSFGIEPFEIAA